MLRSVLAAAFSTVVAIGALSGLAGTKGDVQADSSWRTTTTTVAAPKDSSWIIAASGDPATVPGDSSWSVDDSSWAEQL
ncbi:hypothetical protein [Streptomyces justiciae]|uniref:hypothetical protein n=1 Tax=Streptomyces justiciae TaxID=2780140 RepID=UPI001880E11B|nr:hypothetical protein [Streptomyces justiciae]MBE8471208.1 hypothetical protein [Streptomyces justiciae]MCW8377002.1 hypothetical protein [Streptomyces justiciae]